MEGYASDDSKNFRAAIVIQNGVLTPSKYLIFQQDFVKIDSIKNHLGEVVDLAKPGDIVLVSGFTSLPTSTEMMVEVADLKTARMFKELSNSIEVLLNLKFSD